MKQDIMPVILMMVHEVATEGARERLKNALDKYKELLKDDTPLGQVKQTAAEALVLAAADDYAKRMNDGFREYLTTRKQAQEMDNRA